MRDLQSIEKNWIDSTLGFLSASFACYAVGMSLGYAPLGLFFVGACLCGALFSFVASNLLRGFRHTAIIGMALYVILAMSAPFLTTRLNDLLPGGGFPRELVLSAGTLSWMLALGSFATWRDQTLLFQSVPSIALFGLVGAFNTFDGATLTFFGFMLSTALLYSRGHRRVMFERAKRSGYPQLAAIRTGPWRWMAGPEWGLASAAIVILVSIVGAPLLQISMKTVSGAVKMTPPQIQPSPPGSMRAAVSSGVTSPIGSGPRSNVTKREVFRVKTPEPRYLRMGYYNEYTGGSWTHTPLSPVAIKQGVSPIPFVDNEDLDRNFDETHFWIKFSGLAITKLPAPSLFYRMVSGRRLTRGQFAGGLPLAVTPEPGKAYEGLYFSLKSTAKYDSAPRNGPHLPLFVDLRNVSKNVLEWSRQQAKGLDTDIEKAVALKRAIEGQAKYNLNATATPAGQDPVEYFLLGPVREGYCDLFASSMVQAARAVGIPSRYCVGYYPVSLEIDSEGYYVVREADAHAWAELYFEGVGWVPFDTTEGAVAVPGGERGSARDGVPFLESVWFLWGSRILGTLALLLGGAYLVKWARGIDGATSPTISTLLESYSVFIRALEVASGRNKEASETPDEFLTRTASKLGSLQPQAAGITDQFVVLFFGPKVPAKEEVFELKGTVLRFQKDAKRFAKEARRRP